MAHVYVRSGAAGAGTGADWANAYVTLAAALAAKAAGDQFWVAGDHSETQSGNMALTSPGTVAAPCTLRCVNHAGTVPPVSADLTTGAIIATTGSGIMTFLGIADCDGINFRHGSGGTGLAMNVCTTTGAGWRFGPNSKWSLVATNATTIIVGTTSGSAYCIFEGIMKWGGVGQGFQLRSAFFDWNGGSVDAAGSIPTNLVSTVTAGAKAIIRNVDLSALGSGKTLVAALTVAGELTFIRCKLDAAVTLAAQPTTPGGIRPLFIDCGGVAASAGTRSQPRYSGTEIIATNVIRTGGSTTSRKIDTTPNAKFIMPYRGSTFAKLNRSVASNLTVTVEGIANMAAMPKNDEVWNDAEYFGASSSPLGSVKSGAKADILAAGANLTASTEAWDTGATARVNSATYAVGDVIKVASNPGRVFFCTVGGAAAGSEPAGYASAVDGGTVTDNAATFRAGWRFKQSILLATPQPQLVGPVYVYPKVGVASATIYLDRKLVTA